MEEMDVEPVDFREEIGQRIQPRLDAAPVVMTLPVSRQFPRIGARPALVPIVDRLLFGPARRGRAGLELVVRPRRHIDPARADVAAVPVFPPPPPRKPPL